MFVLSNLINALASILDIALSAYMYIVVFAALITWVSPDPYNPIVRFLYKATEPVFYKIRRILPISGMGIDFSPMIAIFIIIFLQKFLVKTLYELAMKVG